MATKRLITSKELLHKLTTGEYKEIIEFAARRDNDLDVQIRDNYLNIYYKGGNFLRIMPRSFYFDEFYFHRGVISQRKTHLIKEAKEGNGEAIAKWNSYIEKRQEMFKTLKEKGGICRYYKEMTKIMQDWEEELKIIHISHSEKNEQQLISLSNRGDTAYTVIDTEYAVSTTSNFKYNGGDKKTVPRFDIIAVDKTGQLFVIELKTGLGSIEGTSGIDDHLKSFNYTIGRDVKGEFLDEMDKMVEQKKQLQLIGKDTIVNKSMPPKFVFAFSDKEGENCYGEFVAACRKIGYTERIIYLDSSHQLKDL